MSVATSSVFASWLRAKRVDRRMTQRQLEEASGVDQSTIARLELGQVPQTARDPATIRALARGMAASEIEAMMSAGLWPDEIDLDVALFAFELTTMTDEHREVVRSVVEALRRLEKE